MPPLTPAPTGPTLTIGLANFSAGPRSDHWDGMLERARIADEAGVDRIVVVDHTIMSDHIEEYDGGQFPTGPDGLWLEPLTCLGVIAGMTKNVRLSTGIILAALRRPSVFAKTVATLDVLSGGRVDLGVGVGWQREEYEAAGLRFEERGRLLDETLAVCQTLWTDSPARYESERLQFDRIWCEPKPAQAGGVPIWVSGRINKNTLNRIVRFGSAWIPWGEYQKDVPRGIAAIREAFDQAGREWGDFKVRGGIAAPVGDDGKLDLAAAMEPVPALVEAGVTDFSLGARLPDDPKATADILAEAVAAFRKAAGR